MLKSCRKCKDCHNDLTIKRALVVLEMSLAHQIENCNNEDQAEICMLHRKLRAYKLIVDTLKKHGIIEEK